MADPPNTQSRLITTTHVIAGDHLADDSLTALVAPTTAGDFNTLEERLILKGCVRLEDILFAFDSSFLRPETADDMPLLADLRDKHKQGDLMPVRQLVARTQGQRHDPGEIELA